jgi:hypothetical protein
VELGFNSENAKEDTMAKQGKVPDKAKKDGTSNKKFRIETDRQGEVEIVIDLFEDGEYEVEKLETGTLPTKMPAPDNNPIRWFNNFSIKENGNYIKKRYKVTIPGLKEKLKEKDSRLVIYSDTHKPKLYYYEDIDGDTFELKDGDPANGMSP